LNVTFAGERISFLLNSMKTLIIALFLYITGCCLNTAGAQPSLPGSGHLYSDNIVPRIDILINPDTLNWIYENVESDTEHRAVFVFDNGSVHDTIRDIGFRLRGNTSRVSQKKSFKVSFNTFIQGRKYNDVEKMNLNGEHNDPSVSRSLIYWHILRKANLAGARANHIQLFINGNYHGLYANVEHIDEEYVKKYFGSNDGNLYKCTWPADLTYQGSSQQSYKFHNGNHRTYDLKTNEEADDYTDLVNLIKVLNNTSLTNLPCELEKVFNVQDFLKVAAIDVLTANWDGYIFNKNNFYLYHNPATDLFDYIPYDVDNSFGIDWFNINWSARNIYNWANSNEPRPLFKRLMQVPEYKAQYTLYMKEFIEQITSDPELSEYMGMLEEQARPFVVNDPFYPLDYGFTIQTYNNSWRVATGDHVANGIRPFIQQRNASALNQMVSNNAPPAINHITSNTPLPMQKLIITARVTDSELSTVNVQYSIDGSPVRNAEMNDTGNDEDQHAGDGIFTAVLPVMPENTTVEYSIIAVDNNSAEAVKPCSPLVYKYKSETGPVPFTVWPNPVTDNIMYLSEKTAFSIYDLTGRKILEKAETTSADLSVLKSGIFILEAANGHTVKIVISE
jgi:spore coat protein CotH